MFAHAANVRTKANLCQVVTSSSGFDAEFISMAGFKPMVFCFPQVESLALRGKWVRDQTSVGARRLRRFTTLQSKTPSYPASVAER